MKNCPAALATFLNLSTNTAALIVDLYTFSLAGGSQVLRYSGGTTGLTVPAASFPSGSINAGSARTFSIGPKFQRTTVTAKIGVDPPEVMISVGAGSGDLVGTFTFAQAADLGFFDGAIVELDRLVSAPQPGSDAVDVTMGCVIWFYGRVSEVEIGRSKTIFHCKPLTDLMAITQFPRRIVGSSCNHVYGGQMCGYDRTNGLNALGASTGIGQISVTAQAGTTQGLINTGGAVNGTYAEGTITGVTGLNAGIKRTAANTGNGTQIGLFVPFPYPINVGDTFAVLPGCDHTVSTCQNTMNNLGRYGGFPHVPPPEEAV